MRKQMNWLHSKASQVANGIMENHDQHRCQVFQIESSHEIRTIDALDNRRDTIAVFAGSSPTTLAFTFFRCDISEFYLIVNVSLSTANDQITVFFHLFIHFLLLAYAYVMHLLPNKEDYDMFLLS